MAGQTVKFKPLNSSGSKRTGGKWFPRQMALFNSCIRSSFALLATRTIAHSLPCSLKRLRNGGQRLKATATILKTRVASFVSSNGGRRWRGSASLPSKAGARLIPQDLTRREQVLHSPFNQVHVLLQNQESNRMPGTLPARKCPFLNLKL